MQANSLAGGDRAGEGGQSFRLTADYRPTSLLLSRVKPVDLAQAGRLAGVTRSDLALLALTRSGRGPA